jgi:hypothetical protein
MKSKPKQATSLTSQGESNLAMLEQLPDDALLTPQEAAKVLRVAAGTLSIWRWRCKNNVFKDVKKGRAKYHVPHITIGALVRYRMSDLRAFQAKAAIGPVGVIYRPRKNRRVAAR